MDHDVIYPADLAPGYGLTAENLNETHARLFAALAADPEHAATVAATPWAGETLLETARKHVTASAAPLYDFDLAFNYWNWLYQFGLYGQEHALAWDRLEQVLYPRLNDPDLNAFCLNQGLSFVENGESAIEKWQPILPGLLNQLEVSGVRVICNHATWMSQGILIVLFHHALKRFCVDNPAAKSQVERLGLLDPMEMGTKVHTLLGPWITTLGRKLNPAISDLSAMAGVQAMSNVIKVFPDTPSGRFECCAQRWKGEVRKALRLLRQLETTPGNLIFETPSGQQDDQRDGLLLPGPMPKAAVRLSRSRPNQIILVGMDERRIFDHGVQEGGFTGGIMQPGAIGCAVKSYIGNRPNTDNANWPFECWSQMEADVANLIEDAKGKKIGRVRS